MAEYTIKDAKRCGALCDRCAFSKIDAAGFVGPEYARTSPKMVIVAEAPGGDECEAGQPLVGASGQLAMKALRNAGLKRSEVHLSNAVLCLDGMSMVRMAGGSIRRIGELVAKRIQADVLSVNARGELVSAKITDWHRSALGDRKMYRVSLDTAKGNPKGLAGVTVTEDHTFLTLRGWIAAKDLTASDLVAVGESRMFGVIEEVFVGTMLGDATIQRRRLSFSHVFTNEDYARLKMEVFSHFNPTIRTQAERFESSIDSTIKTQVRVALRACQSVGVHQDRWYPNGKKIVPRSVSLTPLTLAVWFMDDGYMRIRQGRRPLAELATNAFSEDDINVLIGLLSRQLGLEAYYRDASGWRIYFDAYNSDKLAEMIAPYVPASMQYKLPEKYRGQFEPSMWRMDCAPQTMWSSVTVTPINDYKQKTVYCIDVEGTHNFVTLGGVVHNCRPSGNKMDRVRVQLKKLNDVREQKGMEPLLHPVDACRPRLMNELAKLRTHDIVTMGGVGLQGVTGTRQSVMNIRGAPLPELAAHPDWRVFPTMHPAFVLRALRWRHVFYKDVSRAVRFFRGTLGWVQPRVIYKPTVAEVERFFELKTPWWVADYETTRDPPLLAKIRCIGVGTATGDDVIVVPFLSIDGITKFYSRADEKRLWEIFRHFWSDKKKLKCGHNLGSFDNLVTWRNFGVFIEPYFDTILLHRSAESEMPHNLAYVGSVFSDIDRAWKSEHTAVEAKSDRELWEYNGAGDIPVTARIVEPLKTMVKEKQQGKVVLLDHKLQNVCTDMHINGIRVDMKARNVWDAKLLKEAIEFRRKFRDAVGNQNINPASVMQLRDLLYVNWNLPVINETKLTKEPSTDDDTILALLMEPGLSKAQRAALHALRMFRRRSKLRGTYTARLRPMGVAYKLDEFSHDDEDGDWEDGIKSEADEWRKRDEKKEGIVYKDGRVRSNWMVHGTNTGRFSSSAPNMQNIRRKLRNMFIPEDGHCFVYADMDQLELRLITLFSGAKLYKKVFAEGGDPHSVSTLMVMGAEGKKIYDVAVAKYGTAKIARKKDDQWSRACDFGKRFVYAAGYMAQIETIMDVLRSAEDDDENLLYLDLDIGQTQVSYDNWLGQAPEIKQWWSDVVDEYRNNGFLSDIVTGRRCDFMDGEDTKDNQVINYKCQSSGAGIVNESTLKFIREFPRWKHGKYTGLVQQGHDALMVEAPKEKGEETRVLLEECMYRKIADMEFTASAKILEHWGQA